VDLRDIKRLILSDKMGSEFTNEDLKDIIGLRLDKVICGNNKDVILGIFID